MNDKSSTENYKTLETKFKNKYINKTPSLLIEFKVVDLKLIYRCNTIPIRIPTLSYQLKS